jgi:competence protein ComEC
MKRKGIFLTGYISKQNWIKTEEKKSRTIKRYAAYLQSFLSNKLLTSGLSNAEYSVAAAILLGNDETLEPELRASYAATGVSHILCVSGMHVGIIFMILSFLLKPLDTSLKTRYLKNTILLIAVWVYANITGLAPSVTRSAAMFTFVIIGTFMQRKTNIFHSLFASLFILLSINPLLLFEVGFQLSYLAVFGIVLFQDKIAQWYHPKTKITKYLWELIAVSIAAQILTSPIAIYYFAQFPNYFLLTNLFVIPLSFGVVILGVATLFFSFNSFISNGLGYLLNFGIKTMNEIIMFIEKIPGALTSNISIHITQVIVLYMMIVSYLFLKNKNKQLIFTQLTLFNILILTYSLITLSTKNYIDVINYDIPKCAALQFCNGGNAVFFSDSIRNEQDKHYQYHVQPHDRKRRIRNQFLKTDEDFENAFLCKKGKFIFFQNEIYKIEKDKKGKTGLIVYNNEFSNGSAH